MVKSASNNESVQTTLHYIIQMHEITFAFKKMVSKVVFEKNKKKNIPKVSYFEGQTRFFLPVQHISYMMSLCFGLGKPNNTWDMGREPRPPVSKSCALYAQSSTLTSCDFSAAPECLTS